MPLNSSSQHKRQFCRVLLNLSSNCRSQTVKAKEKQRRGVFLYNTQGSRGSLLNAKRCFSCHFQQKEAHKITECFLIPLTTFPASQIRTLGPQRPCEEAKDARAAASTAPGGSLGPAPRRSEAPHCLQRRFAAAPLTSSCANIVANEAQEAAQPHRSLCWFYHPAAAPLPRHGSPATRGVAVPGARPWRGGTPGCQRAAGPGAAGWEPPKHSQLLLHLCSSEGKDRNDGWESKGSEENRIGLPLSINVTVNYSLLH